MREWSTVSASSVIAIGQGMDFGIDTSGVDLQRSPSGSALDRARTHRRRHQTAVSGSPSRQSAASGSPHPLASQNAANCVSTAGHNLGVGVSYDSNYTRQQIPFSCASISSHNSNNNNNSNQLGQYRESPYDPAFTEARMEQLQRELSRMNADFDKLGKSMAKQLMRSEMQVDSAMKTAVKAQEAVQSHSLAKKDEELQAAEDEDAIWPQTIDQTDLANIFSISMERALTLPRLSVCHTLREIVASTTLLALQTLYCFGLAESSELMQQRGHLTAHADTILLSSFYPHTTVEGVGQKTLPRIHLAASLCSLLLLALSMKNGSEGTVLTVCPLDVVAFSSTYGHLDGKREGGMIALLDSVYAHVCLVLLAVYMQVLWTVRVALLPSLAALASAAAFAGSTTTQDIVLTSVLIAFVLNLDEFLYRTVKPERAQNAAPLHRAFCIEPTSPLVLC